MDSMDRIIIEITLILSVLNTALIIALGFILT